MRKIKDLKAEEFPDVDPKKFAQWKQKRIKNDTISGILTLVVALTFLLLVILGVLKGFLWVVPIILAPVIVRAIFSGPVNKFAAEIGIIKDDLQSALKRTK
jgi:uncharacterized membrane protein